MKKLYSLLTAVLVVSAVLVSSVKAGEMDVKKLPSLLGASNAGTEFYFSFPPCYEEESAGYQNSCRVFVASGAKQLITCEIPGRGYKLTKLCQANDVVEFVLATGSAQPFLKAGSARSPVEQVYPGAAVHVISSAPVVCYGVTRYNYTSDGFLAVPVSALGKEYIVASWPQYTAVGSGYQLAAETTISAAYDDTEVFFEMGGTISSSTGGGLKPGKITSFTLAKKGDVLCFGSDGDLQDISGSRITSSKPVAVVSANQCANVPAGIFWCDYTCEMELPTFTWGREYHVTPFFTRKKNPIMRIFAKEKNTTVYRDGKQWLIIPRGTRTLDNGFVERRADDGEPRAIVISADKPIYVELYNSGQQDDNVVSDPFQLVLTPLEQYQKEIVWCTPGALTSNNNFKSHYVNLVYQLTPDGTIPDDIEFAISVNGKFEWKKVSSRFGGSPGFVFSVPVNNQKYACKQLVLPGDNVYRLRAKTPFAAYAYGFSSYDSYGMPTSVALGNLEVKDSVNPDPKWLQKCDGTVEGGTVTDYPDDDASRSNLALIYMDLDSSTNYEFAYDTKHDFIAGTTRTTDWTLKVIDPSIDARAFLVFIDRAGNDTVIVVEYKAFNLTMEPGDYVDFGVMKHDVVQTKTITLRNTGPTPLTVHRLELKNRTTGFTIENVTLPFTMKPGETKEITIKFTNTADGIYEDQIGVGDTCVFFYKTRLKAEIASPEIVVDDHDYGTRSVGTRTQWQQLRVQNTGRVELVVTGDDHLTALTGSEFEAVTWGPVLTYPITIAPGKSVSLNVDFFPPAVGTYNKTITFSSDAKKSDSICVLTGIAVEPGLIASPYDWGRKRILKGPYVDSIYLENTGSQDVVVRSANGSDPNFNVDLNMFTQLTIKPGPENKRAFPVEFIPQTKGPHTLTINFITNTPGLTRSSKLDGIGIIGTLFTNDIDFDTTVFGTQTANTYKFTVKCEESPYQDSVTITELDVSVGSINPDLTNKYSVDGFNYDKQSFNLPRTLQPGESAVVDICNFLAPDVDRTKIDYKAAITIKSDAELEVTSNWTGHGKEAFTPYHNILAVGGRKDNICVGTEDFIDATISNTGNQTFVIDKLELIPADPRFKIVTPADPNLSFVLSHLEPPKQIKISYTPTDEIPVTVKLRIYSSQLGRDTSVDITGSGISYPATSSTASLSNVEIGTKITVPITLSTPMKMEAGVKSLKVTVEYDGRLLAPSLAEITTGAAAAGFTVKALPVETKGIKGKVEFELESTTLPLTGPGELIKMYFFTYLPTGIDNTTIKTTIDVLDSKCAKIDPSTGTITLSPTCAFVYRKVDSKNVMYSMAAINPNPVGESGAEVEFSVGLKSMTEIEIYNSTGSKVGTISAGSLEPGKYSVKVPVVGLSSGTYTLRLTSGPYTEQQQLVIVK